MYNCHRWSCYLNVIILQVVGNIGKVIQRFSSLNSQVSTLVKSTLICVENSDLPYHLSKSAVQVPLSKYIWRYISMKFCFDNEDLLQNYENSWKNFNSWDHTYNQFCLNVSNSTPEMKHCIICWGCCCCCCQNWRTTLYKCNFEMLAFNIANTYVYRVTLWTTKINLYSCM